MTQTDASTEDTEAAAHIRTTSIDWDELLARLQAVLRLRTTPIGMRLFETVEDMEAVPRVRRPNANHTTDQIVGMACRIWRRLEARPGVVVGMVEDPDGNGVEFIDNPSG
jgi:hypothetical protein